MDIPVGLKPPSPKIQRWLFAAAASPLGQSPPPPVITIEDTEFDYINKVKGWYHRRNWEKCEHKNCPRTGTDYKLMKCAGCGTILGLQTFYCSKKCQRADWPNHREVCGDQAFIWAQESAKEALRLGIKESVWRNCNVREAKRAEGLKGISAWAFDQIDRSHPHLDREKMSLSIHFESSRSGKGRIFPVAFRLESMAEMPIGLPPAHRLRSKGSAKIGVIQVIVDAVSHPREYVDLNAYARMPYYLQQWPWVFGTIASMNNHDDELAKYRLGYLHPTVNAMARREVPEVLYFKAPTNLDNGREWQLYDFAKWQKLFGDVISF